MINESLGILKNASEHGPAVDHMLEVVHWFMFALFLIWSAFFVYVLIRFRKSKNAKADYVGVKSRSSSYLEGIVVIIEAILLLGFAFPLWAKRVNQFPSEKDAGIVRVVAEQFVWNMHYAGNDGVFGKQDVKFADPEKNPLGLDRSDHNGKDDVILKNEMDLPVNKPVIVHLSSKDVVHSFTLRNMRMTQDNIPGMSIPIWFKPIQEGQYEIACAQLCGMGHYRMRGYLNVLKQNEFDQWLREKSTAAAAGGSGYD